MESITGSRRGISGQSVSGGRQLLLNAGRFRAENHSVSRMVPADERVGAEGKPVFLFRGWLLWAFSVVFA